MKIIIEADSKEIADITKALQSQLKEKFSTAAVDAVLMLLCLKLLKKTLANQGIK